MNVERESAPEKEFISTNEFRNIMVKSAKRLSAGECLRIEIGPNPDNIAMYAEAYERKEGLPEISAQDGKEHSGAIFNLIANFKVSIVITETRNPTHPLMVLRPACKQVIPCLASIMCAIVKDGTSSNREEKFLEVLMDVAGKTLAKMRAESQCTAVKELP